MTGQTDELRLRDHAAEWLEQNGETVLLDLGRSWYLGLNQSATRLWSELVQGTTRDRLIERLQSDYGVSQSRAAADVDAFVAECTERGLLG